MEHYPWHMRYGTVKECNEETELKGEDIMIESVIPMFPIGGGDRMSGSTSLSRHRGMTDTLLDIEMIREDYTTMIDGARSRVLISYILMEEIPMIGSAGRNISSMSDRKSVV